jgi:hypothetical protein
MSGFSTAVDNSAWTPYTPTVVLSGGTGTGAGRYKQIGKTVFVQVVITCTASGSLTSATPPVAASGAAATPQYYLNGREIARTGLIWWGKVVSSTINAADNSSNTGLTTGDTVVLTGVYEAA